MRGIFISYRRDDSEGYVGRLYEDLVARFGRGAVFMDVATIKAGRDFRRVIDEQVSGCGVLLVVIGRNWLDAKDESGQRRLDTATDAVRLEVAAALRRDIPVIPVLVANARMPGSEKLPADLGDLAYRNAVELTHPRWSSDVQLLIEALEADLGASADAIRGAAPDVKPGDLPAATAAASAPAATQPAAAAGAPLQGPIAADGAASRPAPARSSWPLAAGLVAALALAGGGGGYYYWNQQVEARKITEKKVEEERIAAEKKAKEEADREAARIAAQKAADDAAALMKAQEEAAAAQAEAGRLAADLKREKEAAAAAASAQRAATDAAAKAQRAAAESASRAQKAAAEAEARARQAVEQQKMASQQRPTPPTAPPAAGTTAWMTHKEFIELRKAYAKGLDFPYGLQASCGQSGPQIRGRFGANPQGVQRVSFGVGSRESYEKADAARTSDGYRSYSRHAVTCPNAGGGASITYIAAVWVQ